MSKPRSPLADYAVYLLVRAIVCILQALSFPTACRFAGLLAWLIYHVDRRHRLVAHENLRHAFPELDDRRRDDLVRAVYRHFCTLLMEMAHLPRKFHPNNWRQHLDLDNARPLVQALLGDRPVLFVTGHLGNWELGGYSLGLLGFRTYAIARRLDNPWLDDFLRNFRERTGQGILDKNDDFTRIQAVLASGGALATLADQDAGQRGQFVNFFNRPASTHKAVALLALRFNVPLVVLGTLRTEPPPGSHGFHPFSGRLKYTVVVTDVIRPEDYESQPDAVATITRRFTLALEQLIRRAPEQYFWLHRRWKHQPQVKVKKSRAA
jgi:KDO2-lipid IV(A) lauroyltransferase